MATYINPQTNKLIIEITNTLSPQEEYMQLFSSILYLIKNQDAEFIDTDKNHYAINLLENLLPDYDQTKRMFADPDETFKALEELKREHFEVKEKLRVTKERLAKYLQ